MVKDKANIVYDSFDEFKNESFWGNINLSDDENKTRLVQKNFSEAFFRNMLNEMTFSDEVVNAFEDYNNIMKKANEKNVMVRAEGRDPLLNNLWDKMNKEFRAELVNRAWDMYNGMDEWHKEYGHTVDTDKKGDEFIEEMYSVVDKREYDYPSMASDATNMANMITDAENAGIELSDEFYEKAKSLIDVAEKTDLLRNTVYPVSDFVLEPVEALKLKDERATLTSDLRDIFNKAMEQNKDIIKTEEKEENITFVYDKEGVLDLAKTFGFEEKAIETMSEEDKEIIEDINDIDDSARVNIQNYNQMVEEYNQMVNELEALKDRIEKLETERLGTDKENPLYEVICSRKEQLDTMMAQIKESIENMKTMLISAKKAIDNYISSKIDAARTITACVKEGLSLSKSESLKLAKWSMEKSAGILNSAMSKINTIKDNFFDNMMAQCRNVINVIDDVKNDLVRSSDNLGAELSYDKEVISKKLGEVFDKASVNIHNNWMNIQAGSQEFMVDQLTKIDRFCERQQANIERTIESIQEKSRQVNVEKAVLNLDDKVDRYNDHRNKTANEYVQENFVKYEDSSKGQTELASIAHEESMQIPINEKANAAKTMRDINVSLAKTKFLYHKLTNEASQDISLKADYYTKKVAGFIPAGMAAVKNDIMTETLKANSKKLENLINKMEAKTELRENINESIKGLMGKAQDLRDQIKVEATPSKEDIDTDLEDGEEKT